MSGFANGLHFCTDIIREFEAVEARRLITEEIHILAGAIAKCEGGHNFYLEEKKKACEAVLAAMYEMVAS